MPKRSSQIRRLAAVIFALAASADGLRAQEHTVDLQALVAETLIVSQSPTEITLVWWMPEEFWYYSLTSNPSLTDAGVEELLALLRPYHIVMAADGVIGTVGGITYQSEAQVRAGLRLVDVAENRHEPLPLSEVNADLWNLLTSMKPLLANTVGAMGENMHVFVFTALTDEGDRFGRPDEEGSLTIEVGTSVFSWRLPLSALLPPKYCPVDGERLDGAWRYCPWHGVELQLEPPDATGPIDSAATEPIQSIVLDEIEDLDGAVVPEWARYVGDTGVMRYALTVCLGTLATIPVERRQFFATVSDLEAAGFGLTNQFDCQR